MNHLVLASRSPQRRAILEQLGVDFEVRPASVEELTGGDAAGLAAENARRKAAAVARAGETVLGVDTVVALGSEVLGKPRDATQARACLAALDGARHEVFSGVCVVENGEERSATARTVVTFRALSAAECDWYAATGEWAERAGGYAIQGFGAALVAGIEGDYTNVVGLPVPTLLTLLPDLIQ